MAKWHIAPLLHLGHQRYATSADYVFVIFDWRYFVYMYYCPHIYVCLCPIKLENELNRAFKMNLFTRWEWIYLVGLVNRLHSEPLPNHNHATYDYTHFFIMTDCFSKIWTLGKLLLRNRLKRLSCQGLELPTPRGTRMRMNNLRHWDTVYSRILEHML